ncbi:metallophosphoesterase family protein [Olivibacter sitiensis]|uniref:metallophosphoesterase family protein n=1 Tax=Olivibacter sitiensis TaxID=376470 RepID=UPI000480BD41|nr:metallophosphoesterase [Olivibacter sitiensis]
MKRRAWIRKSGMLIGATMAAPINTSIAIEKPVLTVAHITDVHIRDVENIPARFKLCLKEVLKHKVDFFLNGGDAIHAADYEHVTREDMLSQWAVWDKCMEIIKGYEVYSCLGNHDMWWAAPSKEDAMYGKNYAVKRLKIPGRYHSFSKGAWHFIVLDSNNQGVSLDEEQFVWLQEELESLPKNKPVLIMSHYPILGITPLLVGGGHADGKRLKDLFYTHSDKVKICLSGHQHLLDQCTYNDVQYCCNGAMSGFWWGEGDEESRGKGYYQETSPGYAILKLYKDGKVENQYFSHLF